MFFYLMTELSVIVELFGSVKLAQFHTTVQEMYILRFELQLMIHVQPFQAKKSMPTTDPYANTDCQRTQAIWQQQKSETKTLRLQRFGEQTNLSVVQQRSCLQYDSDFRSIGLFPKYVNNAEFENSRLGIKFDSTLLFASTASEYACPLTAADGHRKN